MGKVVFLTDFRDNLEKYLEDVSNGAELDLYKATKHVVSIISTKRLELEPEMLRIIEDPGVKKKIEALAGRSKRTEEDIKKEFSLKLSQRYGKKLGKRLKEGTKVKI